MKFTHDGIEYEVTELVEYLRTETNYMHPGPASYRLLAAAALIERHRSDVTCAKCEPHV